MLRSRAVAKVKPSSFCDTVLILGIGKAWNALKTEVPKLLQTEEEINQKSLDAKIMKDTTSII